MAPQEMYMVPALRTQIETSLNFVLIEVLKSDKREVLDVGCGEQPLRKILESQQCKYTSLDIDQNSKNNVDYVCKIDEPLPADLASRQFNFIVCTEVVEHVFDWRNAFQNFTRLLVPNGVLLVTCPFLYPLHEVPFDYWRPTPFALERHCLESGLKVIRQQSYGDGWDVLGTLLGTCYPGLAMNSVGGKIRHRLLLKLLQWLGAMCRSEKYRQAVNLNTNLFLGNGLVAQKS